METDGWALEHARRRRLEQSFGPLCVLFFVSGATSLIYQTVWNRQLHLVFGTSSFAIATVLASFMFGLAMGGVLMGRLADRVRSPLAWYGALEVGIGVWALLLPTAIETVHPVALMASRAGLSGVGLGLLQLGLVTLLLVVPTSAMGATLPLLVRFASPDDTVVGARIGTLYAINTFGAVVGTWVSGFWWLPSLGLWATTVVAAFANVMLGAAAMALQRLNGSQSSLANRSMPTRGWGVLTVAMALAGMSSLIYEVAWTRVLALTVGASVYGFSVMLIAFLIGIALGGQLGGRLADHLAAKHGGSGVWIGLAGIELGVALMSCAELYVFGELPFAFVWLFDQTGGAASASGGFWTSLLLAGAVMTGPAVGMGMAFPLAVRAASSGESLSEPVGMIYGINTLGGAVGAFGAGFLLLPGLGVQGTVVFAACLNTGAALVILWRTRWRWVPAGVAVGGIALAAVAPPPWDPLVMTSGMYKYVNNFRDHSREGIERQVSGFYELVFYEEGPSSVVTVARHKTKGHLWLANNGKIDASSADDLPTQVLCGLLPLLFVEEPKEALVVGLASGISAGAVATVPSIERLEIVEIEPATLRAARHFDALNGRVLDDPRTNVVFNDGRNHVLMQGPDRYDLIVSEPSNPWLTGVSNLFTSEFWTMGRSRLRPGGVWAQWVQLYGMDESDLRSLLGTFAEAFPHTMVFTTIDTADLVLIGSNEPLTLSVDAAKRVLSRPKSREMLSRVGVHQPMDLLARYQMGREEVLSSAGSIERNTDDNMRIEYRAPLNLHRKTRKENDRFLLQNVSIPPVALTGAGWLELARAFERREDSARAILAYREALSQELDPVLREAAELEYEAILERIRRNVGRPVTP